MTGACGDDDGSSGNEDAAVVADAADVADATPVADAGIPDAMNCPAPAAGQVGGTCTMDSDCTGTNPICVDEEEQFPSEGFCTFACTLDAECGAGASCVDIIEGGGGAFAALNQHGGGPPDKICLPDCCAGDRCSDGQLCLSVLASQIPLEKNACVPGNGNASDHDACESFGDCNEESVCITGPESPGGMCAQFNCIVGDNSTCEHGTNSLCVGGGVGGPGACFKQCTADSECRMAEGYQCLSIGALSICTHVGFGAACTATSDCGVAPWTCDTGQPGGYCTTPCDAAGGPSDQCGEDAICIDPDANPTNDNDYCADTCTGPGTCRPNYTCNGGGVCVPSP